MPSLDYEENNCNGNPSESRPRYCGVRTLTGAGEDPESGDLSLNCSRLFCKCWSCARCGPKKVKQFRRQVTEVAVARRMNKFLTLTLNPSTCSAEDSVTYINNCWAKFRVSLQRQSKSSVPFIKVVELQKSGYAHLHILVDCYLKQQWVSQAWEAVGGGRIVDIRYVDVHRIASYLSKYLVKNVLLSNFRRHQRRWTTSRDIKLFAKRTVASGWSLSIESIDTLYRWYGPVFREVRFDKDGVLVRFSVPIG